MTNFDGTPAVVPDPSVSAETVRSAQLFCTVEDLIADAQAPGVDDARMFQAIREASDYIQKAIGWFLPVTLIRSFNGGGNRALSVPPLLAISALTHDDVALSAADYLLKPDDGFWANGPYVELIRHPDSTLLGAWSCEQDGDVIAGRWGLYERSGDTGAVVGVGQNSTSQLLTVSDGSKLSPGMVLLIGTEQESVIGWGAATEAVTALNGAIAATDEIVTVDDGSLVNVGERLRVDFEQMLVKDKRANQCSVLRSWNGTARVSHADNAAVDVYRTVNVERNVNGTSAAAHLQDVAISRYFAPDDVQYLTKQIATLIVNKAKGGYQGRTGNQELGVVFYHDAFPRQEIAQVKANYYIPNVGRPR